MQHVHVGVHGNCACLCFCVLGKSMDTCIFVPAYEHAYLYVLPIVDEEAVGMGVLAYVELCWTINRAMFGAVLDQLRFTVLACQHSVWKQAILVKLQYTRAISLVKYSYLAANAPGVLYFEIFFSTLLWEFWSCGLLFFVRRLLGIRSEEFSLSYGGSSGASPQKPHGAPWGAWCQVMKCLRAAYNNEQQAVEFLGSQSAWDLSPRSRNWDTPWSWSFIVLEFNQFLSLGSRWLPGQINHTTDFTKCQDLRDTPWHSAPNRTYTFVSEHHEKGTSFGDDSIMPEPL